MKTIYSLIITTLGIVASLSVKAQPFPQADPAVITITKQGPSDPAPTGTNINMEAILKFRIANNSAGTAAIGRIPAGAVTYTVQFNPYYTYESLVATSQFAVTYAAPGSPDYVVQLTNLVDIDPGDVLDFYLNVVVTQPTNSPAGEIVTLNVDRNIPIQCGNTQTANDNVFKSFTTTANIILPVHRLDLMATWRTGNVVDLKWTTTDEVNTSHFMIERSADGINFHSIGTKDAAGTTTGTRDYSMTDNDQAFLSPLSVVYYRVQLVDLNGAITYSKIVSVKLTRSTNVSVWPNPFADKVNVQISSESKAVLSIRIYNSTGSLVVQRSQGINAGQNYFVVDQLDKLSAGYYTIEILDGSSKISALGLIKR